jgi:putative transposase
LEEVSVGEASPSYKGHRYPAEVISHCVGLCFRFPLSFREVEELMLQRGVIVSHETVRRWCGKFGQQYANTLCRRQPRHGDTWHLDEVFIKVNGERKYLWRAVDQDGLGLDVLVQSRRDKVAARCRPYFRGDRHRPPARPTRHTVTRPQRHRSAGGRAGKQRMVAASQQACELLW